MAKILVADDERAICDAFSDLLQCEGHTPLVASNGEQAIALTERERPSLVFLDVQMAGMNGLAVLADIRTRHPGIPVIVMTAYGTVHTAMEAMRLGAFDYLGKPVELSQIRALIKRALHRPASSMAVTSSPTPVEPGAEELVGCSAAMQEIFKLMGLLTTNDLTVLIVGESGVGKELVARGIHTHGIRRDRPFVAVNCAAIPELLMESELFGHEKGAFTGAGERRIGRCEAAADGTLFLDEISELPYPLQGKLLRVLQERSFERIGSNKLIPLRARIIAATNRNLASADEARPFRSDLYHRLNLVTLNIPPLRQRKEDVGALAGYFLARANAELGKQMQGLEAAALTRLEEHDWPGNVRELGHTIRRSVLIARGELLSVHDLGIEATTSGSAHPAPAASGLEDLRCAGRRALRALIEGEGDARLEGTAASTPYQILVNELEQTLVAEALRMTGANQVAASKLLGVNRTTLRKKIPSSGPNHD